MKLLSSSRRSSPEIFTGPSKEKDSHCVKVIKILLAALPSVIFGVFTIIFTIQQNQTANENRIQDQNQADEQNIRSTFENYIDDISELLLNTKFTRSNSEHLLHIRVKTLTVLRYVDAGRKRDIILFLYESGLLRSDARPNERLHLTDANLNGIEFVGSSLKPIQLDHLYLPGVYLPNAIFHWCILDYAVFDNSSMSNAKIINSSISHASFRRVYAPDSTMGDLIFHHNNFSGAIVVRTTFVGGGDWKEGNDFTNVDLLDSYGSRGELMMFYDTPRNIMIASNTRSGDGSFYDVDSSELIIDGGAELGVSSLQHFTIDKK
jgi:uncharacterized protein YjbI with pentapeptide repeats